MDIRHLQYFAEVAKQMSFTKAASTLHVSQPSLSKTVKQLETELGVPLFYRSKVLQLTGRRRGCPRQRDPSTGCLSQLDGGTG